MQKFAVKRTGQLQVAMFRAPSEGKAGDGYTNLELVSTDNGKVEVLQDLYIKGNHGSLMGKKVETLIEVSARLRDNRAELRGEVTEIKAI